jgi:excisionase family DNA binding protein
MTVQTAPDHASELLTVADAMEGLRCSESTVRRLIGSGELAAFKIGTARAIRIPRAGLAELLAPVEPGSVSDNDHGKAGAGGA